jgi:protein transport protein SEC24
VPGYREKEKERKKEEKRLRKPRPLGRVFVIDVSGPSVHRGIVREVCEGIRRALYGSKSKPEENDESRTDSEEVEEDTIGSDERIAIVTVAETVGFWNLSVRLASLCGELMI